MEARPLLSLLAACRADFLAFLEHQKAYGCGTGGCLYVLHAALKRSWLCGISIYSISLRIVAYVRIESHAWRLVSVDKKRRESAEHGIA